MSVAEQIGAAPAPVPTPCIGICDLDETTGLCRGCARNGEEIAAWQQADAPYKQQVWEELPYRRADAGLNAYRLPWSADDIAAMIERTLRRRWGRWVLGIEGASASFEIDSNEDADIISRPDVMMAITARGAIRLLKHHKTIAVAFGNAADEAGPEAIGLILPRGRVELRKGDLVANAGPDLDAIAACRDAQLFDLGVTPMLAARFCLRTDNAELIGTLDRACGKPWREALDDADAAIDIARPHRLVETGLGRIEVFAPPLPDSTCNTRTELRSSSLEEPRELPAEWTLPNVFAPCAVFYPHSRKPAEALLDGHF